MIRAISTLFICLLHSGCERPDQSPADAEAAGPAQSKPALQQQDEELSAAPRAGTSVMRPSVVAEAETEAPPAPPEPARATIPFEEGIMLGEAARAALDDFLTRLEPAGSARIVIRGHSDSQGSDRQNLRASERRAEAVRDYLVQRGIPADRMTLIALGETRPAAPNANLDGSDFEEGRRKNRRVEIEAVPAPTPAAPDEIATAPAPAVTK